MKWKDVPKSWGDRCSGDGYSYYVDNNGIRRYQDNDISVKNEYRPCAKCGHYPINDGEDYCLQHLGNVMNACCGHGNKEGYIQFDNGVTVRGYFEIEHDLVCCGKRAAYDKENEKIRYCRICGKVYDRAKWENENKKILIAENFEEWKKIYKSK